MVKKEYWEIVKRVIKGSDIVIEVLDARFINETRNKEMEKKVRRLGKKLIYVINKCDLAPIEMNKRAKKKLRPCIFISAQKHLGTNMLRELITRVAEGKRVKVGVVGYPNTGKSSLINALKGKKSARTSPIAGFTKAKQWVRVSRKVLMIDTPGVIPFKDKSVLSRVLIADYSSFRDPDILAMDLIELFNGKIEDYYKVEKCEDSEETLEKIALKCNRLKKHGLPDIKVMGRIIIKDWQSGKIRTVS